jgi:hypothetical protein
VYLGHSEEGYRSCGFTGILEGGLGRDYRTASETSSRPSTRRAFGTGSRNGLGSAAVPVVVALLLVAAKPLRLGRSDDLLTPSLAVAALPVRFQAKDRGGIPEDCNLGEVLGQSLVSNSRKAWKWPAEAKWG